jgi:hypothetical protein
MLKIIRNTTNSDIFIKDTGVTVVALDQYEIQRMDYWLWSDSKDIVAEVVAGNVKINDGQDDLPIRAAIGLLQDNQVIMNEYYTLVQDDDILIGNGEILYLNDEFDTTDNVPDYIDEQIEDDVPTERP